MTTNDTTITTNDQTKAAVRAHYGAFAATQLADEAAACCDTHSAGCCAGDSACCDDSCCAAESALYPAELVGALPATVVSGSRGCGNPHVRAQLQPGQTVLDLGSGGGLDVLLAAQRVGPSGHVYGVDMTDEMLALARRNAVQAGATNVEFLKGDIEQLPLPDQSVDVIMSNCVINLSPDKDRTLGEAFRVLRPGGRLAVSDIVIDGALDDLPLPEAVIRAALDWAGCIAGAPTRAEYQRLLTAAGFANIEIAVEHRYTLESVLGSGMTTVPPELAALPAALLEQLASRFTSSLITAERPG